MQVSDRQGRGVDLYLVFAIGVVAGGLVMYACLLFGDRDTERFGQLGDAMAPFTALLTAGALFAAVHGVRLQSKELELQRQELIESREVMRQQAKAAEESATVQKRLAVAQEALTRRQYESNVRAHYAQIASMQREELQVEARIAEVEHSEVSTSDLLAADLEKIRLSLSKVREEYTENASRVVGVIHIAGHVDRDDAS